MFLFPDGGLGIPVVLVVVEGGTDAIADAKCSLEHRIPVVVCSGTGRAADILAYAYSHLKTVAGSVSFSFSLYCKMCFNGKNQSGSKGFSCL